MAGFFAWLFLNVSRAPCGPLLFAYIGTVLLSYGRQPVSWRLLRLSLYLATLCSYIVRITISGETGERRDGWFVP